MILPSFALIENFPSKSVITPSPDELFTIEAPGSGIPFSSTTEPEKMFWADKEKEMSKSRLDKYIRSIEIVLTMQS